MKKIYKYNIKLNNFFIRILKMFKNYYKLKIFIYFIFLILLLNDFSNLFVFNPILSIIIPIYNDEKFLPFCLNSIINQTIKNIEIICIDDGSTDNSLKILKKYKKKDNRLIIISQKNQGSGIARNRGINMSRGQYLAFMDSDDIYPNNYILELMYNKCTKNNVFICGGGLKVFQTYNKTILFYKQNKLYIFKNEGIINYIDYQFDFGYYRFLFNTQFIKKNKIYFPNYLRYQDPPFFVKAMILAKKFYALKETTYLYRNSNKVKWNERKILDQFKGIIDCLILSEKNNLKDLYCKILIHLNSNLFLTPLKIFIKNKNIKNKIIIIIKKYITIKKCNFNLNNIYKKLISNKNL